MEELARGTTASVCRSRGRNPDRAPKPGPSFPALLEVYSRALDKTLGLRVGASLPAQTGLRKQRFPFRTEDDALT